MDISELYDSTTNERLYLNQEERQAFFKATTFEPVHAKLYCHMLYYTGCRRNEALEVAPADIDFSEKGVLIDTLKQPTGKPLPRFIELPDSYLETLHNVYDVRSLQVTKYSHNRLWNFTERTANNYVKAVMKKAKLTGKKATPKGLRHSMGVMLAQNKTPINVIQKILGHRHIKNTQIYLQITGAERRNMISQAW